MYSVTPWEVSGKVDYDELIRKFGTKPLTPDVLKRLQKHTKQLHPLLRRNFYYSHRDLDLVLADHEAGTGFFLYTGRGPSGPMHIGHLIPFLTCKWLQDAFGANLYIQVTDDEKFVQKRERSWAEIQQQADADILDIAALGFDPDRTFLFKDSEYVRHAYPKILEIARKVTFSTAKAVFGFENETNLGMIFYPAYQVFPTFFEQKRCLIPAAIDQDPYWRIQRDVAEDLGFPKTAAIHSKLLPPLTGPEGKMSSSDPANAIFLTDDEKTVKNKIYKHAFSGGAGSLGEHRRTGGNPDVDVAFQWLKILFEPDDKKLASLESGYRSGKVTTGEMKDHLIEKLNAFLAEHRKSRAKAAPLVKKMMRDGKLAKRCWEKL